MAYAQFLPLWWGCLVFTVFWTSVLSTVVPLCSLLTKTERRFRGSGNLCWHFELHYPQKARDIWLLGEIYCLLRHGIPLFLKGCRQVIEVLGCWVLGGLFKYKF
ncbi:hypothetical protein AMECASPLE_032139 [Ameca splendens]|uniref:Uncharacterized protein n=1 Tax=Ameca splendens TaxID=208324 RepID=A0ABV0ZH49_9TELE